VHHAACALELDLDEDADLVEVEPDEANARRCLDTSGSA